MCLIYVLIVQNLDHQTASCFQLLYQSWAAWGVYRLQDRCLHSLLPSPAVESQQQLSLFGFGWFIHSRGSCGRGGFHTALKSTKHVIYMNTDVPWGCFLLWCDLLVSVQPWMALCAITGPCGEGLERATIKEAVVDLERQMGRYIKWVCGDLINWLI